MKKLFLLLMVVAIAVGLYEQNKEKPNIYVLIPAIVIFMYGMMKLSAKTLHHNDDKKDEEDDNQGR